MNKLNHIIGLLAVLLLGTASCRKSSTANNENSEKFSLSDTMYQHIHLDTVKVLPVHNNLRLIGKVIPDENKVLQVYPLVGGSVEEVTVELGDYVEKGQVLAVIRSGEVADFDRQLTDAQSELLMAQKNQKVAEDLFSSKLSTERDVLMARKEVEKSQAELNRIKEIFHIYGLGKSSQYVVKSPISGFIIEKKINRDMQLRSDKSDNLFTISQINDVWIIANVNESDISKVKTGFEASIETISYPDEVFHGKVDKIYNVLDPETKTMKIRIRLENPGFRLKPGMNATANLLYDEDISMIAVPSSAVIFDKSKNFVMVYHSRNNIETREVQLHLSLMNNTYISKGLKAGERIISKGQLLVYDALND